jgi:hypothetical protein
MVEVAGYQIMDSDGEYKEVETRDDIKDELDSNTDTISEDDRRYLARFIENQVSLAKSVGRKEAEMRGESKMKQMFVASAASALFAMVAAGATIMRAYGMIG